MVSAFSSCLVLSIVSVFVYFDYWQVLNYFN